MTSGVVAEEPDEGLFRTSIPAGFEDLSAPQTSLVDVFFLGQRVDVAMATFAPGSFAFVDPEAVVRRLPQIARPGAITLALSGDLEPHAALVCGTRSRPGCGTLQPDAAGIIFDADQFRVDIFIDPTLLAPQLAQAPRFLPAPEAGFSALETIAVAAAGSTSDGSDFTLRSFSLLAYDTGRLTTETSVSSADGTNLDVLAGEVDHRGWRYIGGLYRTALSSLLGERRLLGAGAASSIETRLDREQVRGSPITVFLPIRAQVEIFREGRLLSSQGYPAGNQVVDTTALPEGAYEVTLRIRQIDGSVREETRFFAKTAAVPPQGAPRYVLEAGLLGTEGDAPSDLTDNAPAIHGGTTHRLTESLALGSDLILSLREQILEISAFYLASFSTFSLSTLGAADGTVGVSLNAYGLLDRFSYGVSGRQMWADDDGATDGAVDPLSLASDGSTRLDLSLSYAFAAGPRIGFRASWHRRDGADGHYGFGPTLFLPLPPLFRSRLDLMAEATRTQEETRAVVRLRMLFDSPRYTINSEHGYVAGFGDGRASQTGMLTRVDAFWKDDDLVQGDLRAGGGVAREFGNDSLRAQADYTGPHGRALGQVEHRLGDDGNTLYGANALLNVVGNGDRVAWGGQNAYSSGVVIAVEGDADASFSILVNERPHGTVTVGQRIPLMLPEYEVYEIRLQAIDAPSVRFDASARTASLFRGTIKTLKWQVEPIFVVFGRLLDAGGRPVTDAVLEGGLDLGYSDAHGYFQLEVAGPTHLHVRRYGRDLCTVAVAAPARGEELLDLGEVPCR
ncbi:MAG: TcfC E-set like domain-containing protein [Geminicoccaceae bacterium]